MKDLYLKGIEISNPNILSSEKTFTSWKNKIIKKIKTIAKLGEIQNNPIDISNPPPFTIGEIDELFIHSWGNFSNFNKLFKCKSITIFNADKTDNSVLSLLLMKNTKIYFFKNSRSNDLPWLKILQKHLNSDKDILECQEELISNGLKQYAKL